MYKKRPAAQSGQKTVKQLHGAVPECFGVRRGNRRMPDGRGPRPGKIATVVPKRRTTVQRTN